VTEQVLAQQALRASEAKFRRLAESNIIGVVVADVQGNLLEANQAFLTLLGYSSAEFVPGRLNWKDITAPPFQYLDEQANRELRQGGASASYEKELMTKQGQLVWVMMAGAQLAAGGGIYFVLDLTAQKQLEKQREVFMHMASHELRNPLAGIKGNLQLLLRKFQRLIAQNNVTAAADKLDALFEAVDGALRQVDLEARLIEDLIDFARVTADQLKISASEQHLDLVVEKAIEDLYAQAAPREIRLSRLQQAPVLVLIDSDRIRQVLINFVTNALKYSPAPAPIDVRIIVEQDVVRVEVQDEGPGLTLEEQRDIWKPYYQTRHAKKSGGASGLGLGLHINQIIVSAHNGQIGVESQPDHGATFWFTLPLIKHEQSETW
jgi:PAS domain S-box-containing protein